MQAQSSILCVIELFRIANVFSYIIVLMQISCFFLVSMSDRTSQVSWEREVSIATVELTA